MNALVGFVLDFQPVPRQRWDEYLSFLMYENASRRRMNGHCVIYGHVPGVLSHSDGLIRTLISTRLAVSTDRYLIRQLTPIVCMLLMLSFHFI